MIKRKDEEFLKSNFDGNNLESSSQFLLGSPSEGFISRMTNVQMNDNDDNDILNDENDIFNLPKSFTSNDKIEKNKRLKTIVNSNLNSNSNSNSNTNSKDNNYNNISYAQSSRNIEVEKITEIIKIEKRKNEDITDMRAITRKGKLKNSMERNEKKNNLADISLKNQFIDDMKLNSTQSYYHPLQTEHTTRHVTQRVTPFQHQLQLQPVSEFLTSLIDTTISPKIDKKSEIQEEKAKQKERGKEKEKEKEKEKQAQEQKHKNDQSFDFSLKNKKSEIIKIRSISRDEDDNESELKYYENITRSKKQLVLDSHNDKYEKNINCRKGNCENSEADELLDFSSITNKLSFSQLSNDSETYSNKIRNSSIGSDLSSPINIKLKTKLIENEDNKNHMIVKKRKMNEIKIVYPYFGQDLPRAPKIIALRCLEFLEGKDFYHMSVLNNLWSKTSIDPALWEESSN